MNRKIKFRVANQRSPTNKPKQGHGERFLNIKKDVGENLVHLFSINNFLWLKDQLTFVGFQTQFIADKSEL